MMCVCDVMNVERLMTNGFYVPSCRCVYMQHLHKQVLLFLSQMQKQKFCVWNDARGGVFMAGKY